MREELLKFFEPREEKVELAGQALVVRELSEDSDTEALRDGVDSLLKFVVRCTFDQAEQRVFTDDDIPALKRAGAIRLAPLIQAVVRVNGFVEDEIKNSGAGPSAG